MALSTSLLHEHGDQEPDHFGVRLKGLREARGLSIEDVAAATHMTTDRVESIEAGTIFEHTPPIFARGFVREYAEFVEADVAQLMEDLDRQRRPERARLYMRGLDLMLHKDYRPGRRQGRRPVAIVLVLLLAAVAMIAVAYGAYYVYTRVDQWLGITEKAPHSTPPTVPSTTPEGDPSQPAADAASIGTSPAGYELAIVANENTWIRVEQGGVLVTEQVLAAGQSYQAVDAESVRLTVRNPSLVRVYKDGTRLTEELGSDPVVLIYDQDGFRVAPADDEL